MSNEDIAKRLLRISLAVACALAVEALPDGRVKRKLRERAMRALVELAEGR